MFTIHTLLLVSRQRFFNIFYLQVWYHILVCFVTQKCYWTLDIFKLFSKYPHDFKRIFEDTACYFRLFINLVMLAIANTDTGSIYLCIYPSNIGHLCIYTYLHMSYIRLLNTGFICRHFTLILISKLVVLTLSYILFI